MIRDVVATQALCMVLEGLIRPRTVREVRDHVAPLNLDLRGHAGFRKAQVGRGHVGLDGSQKGRDPPCAQFDGHCSAGPAPCLPCHLHCAEAIGASGTVETSVRNAPERSERAHIVQQSIIFGAGSIIRHIGSARRAGKPNRQGRFAGGRQGALREPSHHLLHAAFGQQLSSLFVHMSARGRRFRDRQVHGDPAQHGQEQSHQQSPDQHPALFSSAYHHSALTPSSCMWVRRIRPPRPSGRLVSR